jgi:hypothetical protein
VAGTMLRKDMHTTTQKVLETVHEGYGLTLSVVRVNAMELPKEVDKPSMEKLLKILAKPPKRSKKAMKELAARKEEEETKKRRCVHKWLSAEFYTIKGLKALMDDLKGTLKIDAGLVRREIMPVSFWGA